MSRIEALTPAQVERMAEYRDKWIRIGLSTEPANRPLAEKAIRHAYRAVGLPEPRKIVWCGSPLSQGLTRAIILDKNMRASVGNSVGDSVWDSVWASVRDSVGDSVWDSVWASVRDSVRASVGNSVGNSVGDSVRASVWASVWDSVRASVWDSVRASVRASVWASVGDAVGDAGYGQHDANWLAFYEYFRDVCGLTAQTEKIVSLIEQAKHAGWYLPHAGICWVSERHNLLARDARGRLHSISGPAVRYPDGWSIYAVHGVRVPADLIENRASITPSRVESEQNAEVRRVMIELYGQARYLLDSGAQKIHADDWGVLYRKEIPGDEPLVMVKVVNSTPEHDGSMKDYFLRVDPELRPLRQDGTKGDPQEMTARNAVASTFGKRGVDYAPARQT